jgi:hypothetical protein
MSNRAISRAASFGSQARSYALVPVPAPRRRPPQPQDRRGIIARAGHYLTRPFLSMGPTLFTVAVLAILYLSWHYREEGHLTPETGAGYWLGIVGSAMMGVLLLYPLRKRMRIFRNMAKTASWFFWHMILGIVGPMLVLMHSNWKFASLNATVATIVTLIVVASGIIGRYLYTKVHMGLYGRKTELRQIMQDASVIRAALGDDVAQASQFHESLQAFEAKILAPRHNFITQTWAFLTLGLRLAILRRQLTRLANTVIATESRRHRWSWNERRKRRALVRQHLCLYSAVIGKAVRFAIFERLFALWHVLHMPLFFLLVATAITHIIAVHLY